MSEVKLGQLVMDGSTKRDAVHVAVIPVMAGERLVPGQHVGIGWIDEDGCPTVSSKHKKVGIVDPFLKEEVKLYDRFLLFLYPNTVKQLSHDWEHPDIPKKEPKPPENTYNAYDDNYDREGRCAC